MSKDGIFNELWADINKAYDLCGDDEPRILDLMRKILRYLPKPDTLSLPKPGDVCRLCKYNMCWGARGECLEARKILKEHTNCKPRNTMNNEAVLERALELACDKITGNLGDICPEYCTDNTLPECAKCVDGDPAECWERYYKEMAQEDLAQEERAKERDGG